MNANQNKKRRPPIILIIFFDHPVLPSPSSSLPEGAPEMSCCLLHQKLQMLNCCIRHKLAHEHKLNTPHRQSHSHYHNPHFQDLKSQETHPHSTISVSTVQPSSTPDKLTTEFVAPVREEGESASGSEDEFFEALESQEQLSSSLRDGSTLESKDSRLRDTDIEDENVLHRNEESESSQKDDKTSVPSAVCHDDTVEEAYSQSMEEVDVRTKGTHHWISDSSLADKWGMDVAVGVLRPCGDLVLVATGEPLCVPITQVCRYLID